MPAPPFQLALVAAPPNEPESVAVALVAHTVWFAPTLTVAAGLIAIVVEALATGQSPPGLSVVKVSVALPAEISAAVGV